MKMDLSTGPVPFAPYPLREGWQRKEQRISCCAEPGRELLGASPRSVATEVLVAHVLDGLMHWTEFLLDPGQFLIFSAS